MKWLGILGILFLVVAVFHFFRYPLLIPLEYRESPFRNAYHRTCAALYGLFGLIGAAMFFVQPPAERWKLNTATAVVLLVFFLSTGRANHQFQQNTKRWLASKKGGK